MSTDVRAISSTFLTAIIVGAFVGLVIIALLFTYFGPAVQTSPCQTTEGKDLCLTSIQLYSGSPSRVTLSGNCTGDATLVIHGYNLGNNTRYVSEITIFGGSLQHNATTLVSAANSCLELVNGNPEIPPESFFSFVGYVNSSLVPGNNYAYHLVFDNGQGSNGSLIAQV